MTIPLNTLRLRLALAIALAMLAGALLEAAVIQWPLPQLEAWWATEDGAAWRSLAPSRLTLGLVAVVALGVVTFGLSSWLAAPVTRLARALEGAVLSFRDNDFSVSIARGGYGELDELVRLHGELGNTLRRQRQALIERELMLDTAVQNTPVAMILTDQRDRVAYSNIAAHQLLGAGRRLDGVDFNELLRNTPEELQRAVEAGDDVLFGLSIDGREESFHLSQRSFRLGGRLHRLRLFRRMTRELSRQEVEIWKRVIRLISHELNNSLAPMSSLAYSGAELARRNDHERVVSVFESIGDRVRHLHDFLEGYARFARLPAPRPETIAWPQFIAGLQAHAAFRIDGALPTEPGRFDGGQVEQALINLLKNAAEAGGDPDAITLGVARLPGESRIEVGDRGSGMSETVLAQALLPFYSTKRSGTGLGLALAREIAEAHGGHIALLNRPDGGLMVVLTLPDAVG